ncbi:MAG: hypothetical protein ACEQSB_02805 [Undibacterium sp.]
MADAQQMPPTSGLMRTIHWYRFIKRTIVHFGASLDEQSGIESLEATQPTEETEVALS